MPSRRAVFLCCAAALACAALLVSPPARAQADGTLARAIAAASHQRMLVERVTKAWCLLGLGNENRYPRVQLFESIEGFEALLAELDALLVDRPQLKPGLAALRQRWQPFERIASEEPARPRALELLAAEQHVLDAGDRLVRALASQAGVPEARVLDLAGRQAMLAQRLVKTYAYLAWGFDQPRVLDQFVKAWNDYESAQEQLEAFPGNTPALNDALADAAEEWGWLKGSLSLYRADLFYPGIIDDSGEKVLHDIARVTALYQKLLARPGAP